MLEDKSHARDEIYNERYKLIQKIGEGAYSLVFKVEDIKEKKL